jgi:hypothetical protein
VTSVTECVIGYLGGEGEGELITIDPRRPKARPIHRDLSAAESELGLSCPSTTQCTATEYDGISLTMLTFDPQSPTPYERKTAISSLDRAGTAFSPALSCPSISQCTGTDGSRAIVTFDPRDAAVHSSDMIDANREQLALLSCPSTSHCVAIDNQGRLMRFNPRNVGRPRQIPLIPIVVNGVALLSGLSCPSTKICVAEYESKQGAMAKLFLS